MSNRIEPPNTASIAGLVENGTVSMEFQNRKKTLLWK